MHSGALRALVSLSLTEHIDRLCQRETLLPAKQEQPDSLRTRRTLRPHASSTRKSRGDAPCPLIQDDG